MADNVLVVIGNDGEKIVVIPQIIFKGKRSISWKDVEQYLVRYVGEMIMISGTEEFILIDRTFVDEYTGSDYTNKLVGALPVNVNIKMYKKWKIKMYIFSVILPLRMTQRALAYL